MNNKSVHLLMVNYLLNTCNISTDQPVHVLLIDYVPNTAG